VRRSSVLAVMVPLLTFVIVGMDAGISAQTTTPAPQRRPDVIWVPTEDAVVTAMLKMASVTKDDVVYDLGCGDGRIVIAAARQFGARGVGVDIDPQRIAEAQAAADKAGVRDKVQFLVGDIFDPNLKIADATVVALYLLQSMNEKLRPRLQRELRKGARVVSNSFTMGEAWPAEKTQVVDNSPIYFWTIK
jgi:cyclopropane fatty-acyl-phospholipid synthase-like methyltransferase